MAAEPHRLSLRVLRLQNPSYQNESAQTPFEDVLQGPSRLPLDSTLFLPTSFGTVCLGQAFSALVVAANDSNEPVYASSLRVEMQTASSKQFLAQTSVEEGAILQPGDFVRVKVDFEIKEAGSRTPPSSTLSKV
jgi:hypothetical protein